MADISKIKILDGDTYDLRDSRVPNKADKVSSATSGNFAALDANGNLTDSGHKHSDYLTSHQDISGKIDKPSSPATGAFLVYNGTAWVAQTLSTWQGGSY